MRVNVVVHTASSNVTNIKRCVQFSSFPDMQFVFISINKPVIFTEECLQNMLAGIVYLHKNTYFI